MDLQGWIGQQHFVAHRIIDSELVEPLSHVELKARPVAGANSIAWVLWHATRCEDLVVNTICRREPQVLLADGWHEKAGLGDRRMGTGNSDDEVDGFGDAIDVEALLAYRGAVRVATAAFIRTLDPTLLDDRPPLDELLDSIDPMWPDTAEWVREMWSPWPVSLFLNFTALGHTYVHIGEMHAIRTALGIRGR